MNATMNKPSNPYPPREPSPNVVATAATAAIDAAAIRTNGDGHTINTSPPSRRRARRTLKDRIKHNMLHDHSITSSMTSTTSNRGGREEDYDGLLREESVLAAASALASLGVTSPTSSFSGGGADVVSSPSSPMGREQSLLLGQENHYQLMMPSSLDALSVRNVMALNSDVATSASSIGCYNMNGIAAGNNAMGHHDVLSLVRPPPSLNVVTSQHPQPPCEMHVTRPFASLLGIGSDIPLTFPQKLMEVLSVPEMSDVITWLPHGKGFIILQKRKFSVNVMPLYFKHSKFTSFTRKLNRWGFTRVSKGPEMGAYYHKYFQRGNYLLCMQMHCQSHNKPSATITKDAAEDTMDTASPAPSPKASNFSQIKLSPNVTSAMSHLELDSGNGKKDLPIFPLPPAVRKNNEAPTGASTMFTAHDGATNPSSTGHESRGGGTLAKFGNQHHHHLHHYQHRSNANSTFNHAFSRQQEILHRGHQQRHTNNSDQTFRLVQGSGDVNQYQGSPMQSMNQSPMHQQGQPQQPALQQRSHQGNPMHQQPRHSNLDQAATIQKLLGVNTSSSQSHPLVIVNALNALTSCSDQALLTAMMNKEHSKDKGSVPQGGSGSGVAEGTAVTSYQVQSRVHAAMQAQLRQLEEYNREKHNTNMDSSNVQDATHAAMLAQMRQLEKMNNARVAGMATRLGTAMKGPLMSNQMSQTGVAQLYNEINARQQPQHGDSSATGVSAAHSDGHSKRKHPRTVRRAWAA